MMNHNWGVTCCVALSVIDRVEKIRDKRGYMNEIWMFIQMLCFYVDTQTFLKIK